MFHETLFPVGISYGSSGGPGFNTAIVETDSGYEERVSRWESPRRSYNVGVGIKDLTALSVVQSFYIARQGAAYGFRFKDWSDFTTASDHTSAPAPTNQNIGTGNGTTQAFQLRKAYTDGGVTRWRNIRKPVAGTVVCAVNGTPTTSFTVDTTTGIVTFNTAPSAGATVTAGCEFDVPVRFGKEVDREMSVNLDAFRAGSIPNITVVEILDSLPVADGFMPGGSSEIALSFDRTINVSDGRFVVVQPTSSGRSLSLPDPSGMPTGGPYWFISQAGATSFALKSHTGTTLATLTSGQSVVVCLTQDGGGTKYWYAI